MIPPTPDLHPSRTRALAVLGNVDRRILASIVAALGTTLLLASFVLPWTDWLTVLASALGSFVLFFVSSVAWYIGLTIALRLMRDAAARDEAAARAALFAQTGRDLALTLSPARQALFDQIQESATGIQAKARLVPYEGTRALAEGMAERQDSLLPEVEHSLRWAQYLDDQATELAARGSMASEPAKLERVHGRVAEMDAEAQRIATLLVDTEASLLATISERDEGPATDLLEAYATELDNHYEIVRSVNAEVRASLPAATSTPSNETALTAS